MCDKVQIMPGTYTIRHKCSNILGNGHINRQTLSVQCGEGGSRRLWEDARVGMQGRGGEIRWRLQSPGQVSMHHPEGCTCAAGLPHGAGRNPAWASSRHHVSWPGTVRARIKGRLLFLSASAVSSRRGTSQSLNNRWNWSGLYFPSLSMADSAFPGGSGALLGVGTVSGLRP